MPDFDKVHELASRLSNLTKPCNRQEGLASWCMMVGRTWGELAEGWECDFPTPTGERDDIQLALKEILCEVQESRRRAAL
jgi:hypothetical protein